MSRISDLVAMGLEVNSEMFDREGACERGYHADEMRSLVGRIGLDNVLRALEDAADSAADVHKAERDMLAAFTHAIATARAWARQGGVS